MQRRSAHRATNRNLFVGVVLLAVSLVALARSGAKPKPANECLVKFQGLTGIDTGKVTCNECDPSCDSDGAQDKKCTFAFEVCLNQGDTSCTAASVLKKAKVKGKGLMGPPLPLDSACHAFTATVNLKNNGKKKGKGKITAMAMATSSTKPKKRVDVDVLMLECDPQPATCPTTTTTTIPTPKVQICGNGTIETPEVCDRPFTQGGCPSGQICNKDCTACTPCSNSSCACGTPPRPSRLKFTTGMPDIGTKLCIGGNSPPNTTCTKDQECTPGDTCSSCPTSDGTVVGMVKDDTGATACNLRSGGLYFGGVGVTVPLPATVPDMGSSLTNVGCCLDATPTSMQLVATSDTDPGSSVKACTSAAVDNGIYAGKPGCLFGPPLPIPNTTSDITSTCVVNRVATDAAGLADCSTGESQINLPLTSDIYLTGDLLAARCAGTTDPNDVGRKCSTNTDCPGGTCVNDTSCSGGPNDGQSCLNNSECTSPGTCVGHIQACPICNPTTLKCNGGPNDVPGTAAVSCTPGSSPLGDAYPTSHDCPPPADKFIGILPIPFALSTTTQTKVAQTFAATPPGAQFAFCGFCGRTTSPSFQGPPAHPCTSNAECTTAPFTLCEQRDPGAFNVGNAQTITSTGLPAGDITDHNAHGSRLVSVFCIPPAFDPIVDAAGDLPGPGAVSLPGSAQILP